MRTGLFIAWGGRSQPARPLFRRANGPNMTMLNDRNHFSRDANQLLQRLNQTSGITIVLVTHETDIADCAARVVTMRDGRIKSDVKRPPRDAAALLRDLREPVLDSA